VKRSNYIKIAVLLLCSLFMGCVYYNTFWYAKEYYKQAERARKKAETKRRLLSRTTYFPSPSFQPSPTQIPSYPPDSGFKSTTTEPAPSDAQALYEKSIKKASKVLAIYPESDYVDDALFLIGMCYFRMGQYDKAIRKFDELYTNFPKSPFLTEARFYRGWANMMLGNFGASAFEFQEVLDDKEFGEDAAFMLAEVAYAQKDYQTAEEYYLKFIEKYPNSKRSFEAYLKLGDIYFNTDRFAEAETTLEKITDKAPANVYFEAQLLLGRTKIELSKFEEALKILQTLLERTTERADRAEIELVIGELYFRWGKLDEAENIWKGITEKYPKSEASSIAYLRLGELYQKKNWDLKKAADMYAKSVTESPRSQSARVAMLRSQSLLELERVRTGEIDTTNREKLIDNYFRMGEIYLFDLNAPDSALAIYQYILKNYPESPMACKALYGIAWINQYSYKDIQRADSLYAAILDTCSGTDWAPKSAEYFKMRGTALDSTRVRTVAYYFIKAEEFLLTYQWPDSALKYYSKVTTEYPTSRYTPKALLAIALILKKYKGMVDSANVIYNYVAKNYEGTDYAKEAGFQLGNIPSPPERLAGRVPIEPPRYEPKVPAETTTTVKSAPETTSTTPSLPYAPPPKERAELVYPEQEYSSALEGKILKLKILINSFGEVQDAQLLGSSGNPVIDQAAIQAAKKTKFDPLSIDITKYNTWFLYEIRITRPAREY